MPGGHFVGAPEESQGSRCSLGVLHPKGLKAVAQHPEGGQRSRTGLCSCPAPPCVTALHGIILSREGRRTRQQTDHQNKPRLTIETSHSATRQDQSWGSTRRSSDTVKDQVNLKEKPFEFRLLAPFLMPELFWGLFHVLGEGSCSPLGAHICGVPGVEGSPRAAQRSRDDSLDQEPSAPGESTERKPELIFICFSSLCQK